MIVAIRGGGVPPLEFRHVDTETVTAVGLLVLMVCQCVTNRLLVPKVIFYKLLFWQEKRWTTYGRVVVDACTSSTFKCPCFDSWILLLCLLGICIKTLWKPEWTACIIITPAARFVHFLSGSPAAGKTGCLHKHLCMVKRQLYECIQPHCIYTRSVFLKIIIPHLLTHYCCLAIILHYSA